MRPERDDLAAAAEDIGLRLHPEELRADYVRHLRGRYTWGDALEWSQLIVRALQGLDDGMTVVFMGLLANALYDKFKKPDANLERWRDERRAAAAEQREALARLEDLIRKGPERRQLSDPRIAAMVDDGNRQLMEKARLSREFHESVLLKIEESDPAIAEMIDDALRQLEARGAKSQSAMCTQRLTCPRFRPWVCLLSRLIPLRDGGNAYAK